PILLPTVAEERSIYRQRGAPKVSCRWSNRPRGGIVAAPSLYRAVPGAFPAQGKRPACPVRRSYSYRLHRVCGPEALRFGPSTATTTLTPSLVPPLYGK